MCDSEVNKNRREEPPDFSMTDFGQAAFPTEVSVKKAIASDAEIIHQRWVGSEIGQDGDGETTNKQRQRQPANFQPACRKEDPECSSIPLWKWPAHATNESAGRTYFPLALNWSRSLSCCCCSPCRRKPSSWSCINSCSVAMNILSLARATK